MTQFTNDPFSRDAPSPRVRQSDPELVRSLKPLRWIGYGLLLLSAINLAETLFPPKFLDPLWELATLGAIVEQAVLPLMGFGLVFLGGSGDRPRRELFGLKLLSWLPLLIGLLFFLMIPLGVLNTHRLVKLSANQLNLQVQHRTAIVQQVQEKLDQTQSTAELEALLQQLNRGQAPAIEADQPLEQVKEKLSTSLEDDENALIAQVQATQDSQRQQLLKKSIRWNLGALIVGTLFIIVWRCVGWARA